MTTMGLEILKHREAMRSNKAKEDLEDAKNKETKRSNRVKEIETERSNKAKERETKRSNIENENIGYHNAMANRKKADTSANELKFAKKKWKTEKVLKTTDTISNAVKAGSDVIKAVGSLARKK